MTTKEILENVLNAYTAERDNLAQKLSAAIANENEKNTLYEKEVKALRGAFRERNADAIKASEASRNAALTEYAKACDESAILGRAVKVCEDAATQAAANIIFDEILTAPEKWSKYPTHYKKFEKLFLETFGDKVTFYNKQYGGFEIYFRGFSHPYNKRTVFWSVYPQFTPERIEEMKTQNRYNPIAPEKIEETTRAAVKARAEYISKYNKMKEELDKLRDEATPGNSSALYDIFPPIAHLNDFNNRV